MTDMAIPRGQSRAVARRQFDGIINAGDRTKAFRAAKRHSVFVRLMRILCPLAALGVASLYVITRQVSVEYKGGTASIDDIELSGGGLKMVNPRFKGVHPKHGAYDIKADHATQQVANPDLVSLNTITGELVSKSGERTSLAAISGLFDAKKEEMVFDRGLTISGDAGFSGNLQRTTAYFKNNLLKTNDPVELRFHESNIKSNEMTIYTSEKRVFFKGNVRVRLKRRQGDSR